jgi:arabinosyltransferase C
MRLADGLWAIEGGPEAVRLGGSLETMPVVFGLFSGLDLRSSEAPTVEVTTTVHDTNATARQTVAWVLATATLLVALLLLVSPAAPRTLWAAVPRGPARALRQLHLTDAVVMLTLVGWCIAAPIEWDDGWIVARERTFAASGGFSTYYDALGVNLPLDYWVEWLHHWIAETTSSVLLLRIHALFALALIWGLCRWSLRQVTAAWPARWDPSVWALGSAFLVVAMAWDMAIRPEPITALLATGVAACAIGFTTRPNVVPLVIAAVLVPLALTAHHTGVVALAPVVAISPGVARWARTRLLVAITVIVASVSWCVVLAFVGSDVGRRLADAQTTRTYGISSSWRQELERYTSVNGFPYATPLRRESVALIALGLLLYVTRRCQGKRRPLNLPATMLAAALALLVLTPSKFPWHFGALTGLVALAIGAEVARVRSDGSAAQRWQMRPYLIVGTSIVAAAWAWYPSDSWNPFDLRSLTWTPDPYGTVAFGKLATAISVVLLMAAVIMSVRPSRRFAGEQTAWRLAAWMIPIIVLPMVYFTVGVLADDLRRTSGWTLTKQNLGSIVGRRGCGLGDDVVASLPGSVPLPSLEAAAHHTPTWIPPAPTQGLQRFELSSSTTATPWFRLRQGDRFGLFVAGSTVPGEQLSIEWGRADISRHVTDLRRDTVPGIVSAATPWTFVAASELPAPAAGANAVRIVRNATSPPQAPLAVTAPVSYREAPFSRLLREPGATALIHPALLLYFPCARQPALRAGLVDAPDYIVWYGDTYEPLLFAAASPFLGVRDVYPIQRLPASGGTGARASMTVYEVDQSIPGGVKLAPDVHHTS